MPANLVVVLGAEEDGDECEPDDAGAVHGEADVLGLVEVLGDLARLEGVPRAEEYEDHVVSEAEQDAEGADAAGEDGRVSVWIDDLQTEENTVEVLRWTFSIIEACLDTRWIDEQPYDDTACLDGYET